jgi:hypothetical protein
MNTFPWGFPRLFLFSRTSFVVYYALSASAPFYWSCREFPGGAHRIYLGCLQRGVPNRKPWDRIRIGRMRVSSGSNVRCRDSEDAR